MLVLHIFLYFTQFSLQNGSSTCHAISAEVYKHLGLDISLVVAELVLFLQDAKSYKRLLAYRGKDAQDLSDLLQDVSPGLPCKSCLQRSNRTPTVSES